MRSKFPVVLLILLIVSAFLAYQRSQASRRSPFSLGAAAAGMRYQELVDAEDRGEKLNLTCRAIAAGYRICDADTDGPPGHMLAAVNEQGRIAVLRMRFDDTTSRMEKLTGTMTSGWDEVAPRTTTRGDDTGDILRWSSPDKRWSVELVMRSAAPTPAWVLMRDEGGIASAGEGSLPALVALAREGLVTQDILAAAEQRMPGSLLRAMDTLTKSGRALAQHAAKLPRCSAESSLTVLPGTTARETLGEPLAAIAEQAIALAHPGKHLVLGDAAYLVDSAGQGEQVALTLVSGDESGTNYLFALNYQSRFDAVVERAKALKTASQCRAPAEIVVAQVDSTTERVTNASHAFVEAEALGSRVTDAVFTATADGKPAVGLRYQAEYGDSTFWGEIGWWATMPLESMTMRSRLPTSFAKHARDSATVAGAVSYASPEAGAVATSDDPLDPGPLAGRRLVVESERDHVRRSETMIMPSPMNGLPSGWTILSLF